jgi:hypothetical protein
LGAPPRPPQRETRLPPELTEGYGCAELHAVFLQHLEDRGGFSPVVGIQVPETPRQLVRQGLALGRKRRARIQIICNTAEQAVGALALAQRLCPEHRPVALERAAAGAWGLAS